MKFKPVPAEVAALLDSLVPKDPRAERKQMFGMPCAFGNGHLFFGCFEDRLMLKLRAADLAEFLALPGAEPFAVHGRAMREYAFVPRALHGDRKALTAWVRAGFDYVCSLPPKTAKKKGAAKKPSEKPSRAAKTTKVKTATKRGTRAPARKTPAR